MYHARWTTVYTILFNVMLEGLLGNASSIGQGALSFRHQCLECADNLALVTNNTAILIKI